MTDRHFDTVHTQILSFDRGSTGKVQYRASLSIIEDIYIRKCTFSADPASQSFCCRFFCRPASGKKGQSAPAASGLCQFLRGADPLPKTFSVSYQCLLNAGDLDDICSQPDNIHHCFSLFTMFRSDMMMRRQMPVPFHGQNCLAYWSGNWHWQRQEPDEMPGQSRCRSLFH